jgi:purine nucleoside phosphorylase
MPSLPSTYDGITTPPPPSYPSLPPNQLTSFLGPIPIAIIGGTGLRTLAHLTPAARLPLTHPALRTPWGAPSAPIDVLRYAPEGTEKEGPGIGVAFLARHGIYHELAPHEVNNRANVAALRRLGVRCVVAFSAVGSLREEVRPRDFVVVDQVIDRTKGVGFGFSLTLSRTLSLYIFGWCGPSVG